MHDGGCGYGDILKCNTQGGIFIFKLVNIVHNMRFLLSHASRVVNPLLIILCIVDIDIISQNGMISV